MGEPWLDSLSEDWNSEPRLSSPAPSISNSNKYGTQGSAGLQSRIPHLAHNMRKTSTNGSFLKPRSSRGIAKSKGIPVLAERSASSLNLPGNPLQDDTQKRLPSSTLPRRASSNFSDSQQSVQHHTVNTTSRETPEWKKRIQNGEDIASDGFDLFSPSKLEGMFTQPAQSTPEQENRSSFILPDSKPWSSLKFSNAPIADQYQSFRTSRSRAPPMESLPEMNEEETGEQDHGMSAISSELARQGSLRGFVRRRVSDLEGARDTSVSTHEDEKIASPASRDPRWRTLSGQQEIRNEVISPVTASTKNTISAKATSDSIDLDPEQLKRKLMEASSTHSRPSSRSSDRNISYNGQGYQEESLLHEASFEDMTSHSLPEDLSMGTQEFNIRGSGKHVHTGFGSTEDSVLKRRSKSALENQKSTECSEGMNIFRSSPPLYGMRKRSGFDQSNEQDLSATSQDGSVLHHDTSPQRPVSAGSPLKLFGNRDTYTNNKLLRVLSQYEEDGSSQEKSIEELQEEPAQDSQLGPGFRMSQFGKGELDTFHFEKEVTRPSPIEVPAKTNNQKIFQSFADLTIDAEGTIPGSKPSDFELGLDVEDPIYKRQPSSPAKDRTPKRRRTLLKDEIVFGDLDVEINVHHVQRTGSFAGQKRKDARSGEGGVEANPEVLATRSILQPRPGSRKSSGQTQNTESTIRSIKPTAELTEALAAELASFAQGASQAHHDIRKPSLATKDYMEEANKVMEFIRARGKPKSRLAEIEEPNETSILDADKILDITVDDEDSTVEPFSRPPSREGPVKPRENRRVAKHDSKTANHLQRFKDSDDAEVMTGGSVTNPAQQTTKSVSSGLAREPADIEIQHSDPPNIRILNESEIDQRGQTSGRGKRDLVPTIPSSGSSTRRTFATEASNNSGNKGMITSGKVSIPDNVGTMTFDREKQIWLRQNLAKEAPQRSQPTFDNHYTDATAEDDPFEDIPDLSIDENQEAAMRVLPRTTSRPTSASTVQTVLPCYSEQSSNTSNHDSPPDETDERESFCCSDNQDVGEKESESVRTHSLRSAASKHEERLHQGIPSKEPDLGAAPTLQPRVVTIAFSSPVASEFPKTATDGSGPASDDEDYLPPDDSDEDTEYLRTPKANTLSKQRRASQSSKRAIADTKHQQYRSMTLNRRPVSRIEERDEDAEPNEGLSLVRIEEPQAMTPSLSDARKTRKPVSAYKGTSILCLTPLSEFTVHQVDKANHPEESFVQERAHPKALLQAHGALALSVDILVKAITDSVPEEPFWEQLRKLDLINSRLESVHGLKDYCSNLEVLDISHNQVAQLDGLPSTLRNLNLSHNVINDFASWGHLSNLQRINVSGNLLENLDGFNSLVHLRRLKACANNIRDIEGVLDLDGLVSLDLQSNQVAELDFEGVDMSELEELNLRDNKITTIRNLHCLPRLKRLDLSCNAIRMLEITEPLRSLKVLKISENELQRFDLTMVPALVELDLDNNCVNALGGLSGAKQLRKLSLRNQRDSCDIANYVLTTVNECNEIRISSNVLPKGLIDLPRLPQYNLQHLEMAACGLRSLPIGFGDRLPNCRMLNLNFNAISELTPLIGCVNLRQVSLAGNRIKRLRRSCLALSRMQLLEVVDIRDNPLTVGFYAPEHAQGEEGDTYNLPKRSATNDARWLQVLDETTGMKRRMTELLLSRGCPSLYELDGMPLRRDGAEEEDSVWNALRSTGVLVKAIEAAAPSAVETPVLRERNDTENTKNHANEVGMGMLELLQERSVLVE